MGLAVRAARDLDSYKLPNPHYPTCATQLNLEMI
jgi:hypothetical protein